MDAQAYLGLFFNLLPRGRLWRRDPDSLLGKLLASFADGMAAFDAKLLELLENADPRTTQVLIGAWERCVGLPDSCTVALTDIDERRASVWQKLTSTGGQSRPYFIAVAARLGYTVTINGYQPANCESLCDAVLFETSWRFTWCVNVVGAESAPVLECVLSKLKPCDSAVIFTYSGA